VQICSGSSVSSSVGGSGRAISSMAPVSAGWRVAHTHHDEAVLEVAEAQAAILLGRRDTKHAEVAKLAPQVVGEL